MNWAIFPSCCRTVTAAGLLLGLGLWLIPVSGWTSPLGSADLDRIRQQYFTPSQPESQVREIVWSSQNYYVIRVAALNLFDQDSRSRIQQRLELLGKSALLKYLQQKFPGITNANLRYYRLGLLWKEANYSYGLFYVQQDYVSIPHQQIPKPSAPPPLIPKTATSTVAPTILVEESTAGEPPLTSEFEPLNSDDLNTGINVEITRLKDHLKAKPDDLSAWESLRNLYQQVGDVDNINRVLDAILKLKGKISDDS